MFGYSDRYSRMKRETIYEEDSRELKEECGLLAKSLTKVGLLNFEFQDDPVLLEVHVFTTSEYSGDVIETEEMLPKWYNIKNMPFKEMWLDDEIWFPWYLRGGSQFQGYFLYKGHDHIIEKKLESTGTPLASTVFDLTQNIS